MSILRASKRIISIAGSPASGKSTTAKAVAGELGYEHFSTGDLMRSLGAERGLDILDTNKLATTDGELDRIVDGRLVDKGTNEDEFVVDSRMAWHFIPGSLRVYMHVPFDIAAARIIADNDESRNDTEVVASDPEVYAAQLKQRQELEAARYLTKYGVNPYNMKNYDIVLATDVLSKKAAKLTVAAAFRSMHDL